jgi:hypothetical protein
MRGTVNPATRCNSGPPGGDHVTHIEVIDCTNGAIGPATFVVPNTADATTIAAIELAIR